jgi:signal transduction histidine kinase
MALLTKLILLEQRHFHVVQAFSEVERRMLHSQKMAAVGQMSHKIAHSILNTLTVIMGQAERAKREARQVEPLMDEIIASVNSLAEMTGELVTFSVPSTLRCRKMDLSRCLVGVDRLLSKVIGPEVEVVVDGRRDAGLVDVDPNRIEQIIVHMAINAADAMSGRGRLTISAQRAELSESERARLQAGVHERDRHRGDFALLSVQDTGCGMTEEVAQRIFEPFFTTKERRDCAGLGLASVRNIVQTHRGFIDVRTQPGCGTTFLVYLPVVA